MEAGKGTTTRGVKVETMDQHNKHMDTILRCRKDADEVSVEESFFFLFDIL